MFVDTHCHINILAKDSFDKPLTPADFIRAQDIINEAHQAQVNQIINVGTSLIESINCIELAQRFTSTFAAVGIHPNDCTAEWRDDIKQLSLLLQKYDATTIVAVGEIGLDRHYKDYNLQRQKDAFKAQLELALQYDKAVIIHTRQAADETLTILQEYTNDIHRGVIHCFSEDLSFAQTAISFNYALGIGGTITYPKNNVLRDVVTTIPLQHIILETDTPFLPPQAIRGQKNHPKQIVMIANYIKDLKQCSLKEVATMTTQNAQHIFQLPSR